MWLLSARMLLALRDAFAMPASVRRPVDCSQGRQLQISAACRARRSGAEPFVIVALSIFSFLTLQCKSAGTLGLSPCSLPQFEFQAL
jgi:hypothetical protein